MRFVDSPFKPTYSDDNEVLLESLITISSRSDQLSITFFFNRKMNDSYIEKLGIKMLPGYLDPYKHRVLTKGEIGCFLSHYFIWEDVSTVQQQYPAYPTSAYTIIRHIRLSAFGFSYLHYAFNKSVISDSIFRSLAISDTLDSGYHCRYLNIFSS